MLPRDSLVIIALDAEFVKMQMLIFLKKFKGIIEQAKLFFLIYM